MDETHKNQASAIKSPGEVERPAPSSSQKRWASDLIADTLRALKIPFAALNPGASYRGLHDSIVNHLGNEMPQMLLCLHEEHAVAIAHGWAKVTETPMAAILHSNVGLMHGTMAIFNAWCDRVPLLILGATGPVDAEKRRPWIDWIHTSADQGAFVRGYTKWDNQPASAGAAVEAILRANLIARTAPQGPVYVCLDAGLQETPLGDNTATVPSVDLFQPPSRPEAPRAMLKRVAAVLSAAKTPVILCGRGGRSIEAWNRRIALAEKLNAAVITDLKTVASFPNTHPLHAASAGIYINDRSAEILRRADVILSLDWVDLGGTLKTAGRQQERAATIVQVSLDQLLHNGWNMDHQVLPPIDHYLLADPDSFVEAMLETLQIPDGNPREPWFPRRDDEPTQDVSDQITVRFLAETLRKATLGRDVCLVRVPSAWAGDYWPVEHPLDFLGFDGGGGLASGPGLLVGAALALRDTDRIPIAILGDGDFLMGNTALWTAAHYRIPGMVIVANNQSFFNDETHQERVAIHRGRNATNKWIGQRIAEPDIDIAQLALAQGCVGLGPVWDPADLEAVLAEATRAVLAGNVVVVDVRVRGAIPPATDRASARGNDDEQ